MCERGCSGDQKDIRGPVQEPGQGDLHRRSLKGRCCGIEGRRLQWRESSQRKEWHIGYALAGEVGDKAVIASLGHVVQVLHADNRGDGASLSKLLGADVAQSKVANQSLAFEFREHGEGLGNRLFSRGIDPSDTKIDDVEGVYAEVAQVVMDAIGQFLA